MHHPVLATVVIQSQMHVQINHSLAHLATRFNPYFGWYKIYMQNTPAKALFVHAFGFEL